MHSKKNGSIINEKLVLDTVIHGKSMELVANFPFIMLPFFLEYDGFLQCLSR